MLNDLVHHLKQQSKEEQTRFISEGQDLDMHTLFLRIDRSRPFSAQISEVESQLFYLLKGEKHKNEMEAMMIEKKELYDWLRQRVIYSDILSMNKSVDNSKVFFNNNPMTLFIKTDVLTEKKVPAAFQKMSGLTFEARFQQHLTSFSQEVEHRKIVRIRESFQKANAKEGYESFYPELAHYAGSSERQECIRTCIDYFSDQIASIVVWLRSWKKLTPLKTVRLFLDFPNDLYYYEQEYWLYMLGYGFSKAEFNQLADGQLYGAVTGDFNLNDRKPYLKLHGMKAEIPLRGTIEDIVLRTEMLKWIKRGPVNKIFAQPYDFLGKADLPYEGTYLFQTEFVNKQHVITAFENIPFQVDEELLRGTRIFSLIDVWGEAHEEKVLTRSLLFAEVNKLLYSGLLDICLKMDNAAFFKTTAYKEAIRKRATSRRLAVEMCQSKDMWADWLRRGIEPENETAMLRIIFHALCENLMNLDISVSRKKKLFSLYVSIQAYLQGESPMKQHLTETIGSVNEALDTEQARDCKTDQEFYFLAGQCATYLVRQSQTQNKTLDLLQPFFNCKTAGDVKEQLYTFTQRYAHSVSITGNKRFRRASTMVAATNPTEGLNQTNKGMFLAGMMAENALYEKKKATSNTNDNQGESS